MSEQQRGSDYRGCSILGHSKRPRSSAGRAVALAAAGAVAGLAATAHAADKSWVAPASTPAPYEDLNNWSPVGVPGSADVAKVDNGGIAVLSTNQSVTHVIPGSIAGGIGTLQQTGGTLTVGGHVLVAEGGSTSTGRYEMSGGAVNTAGVFWVGSHGTGTLELDAGAITANAHFQVGANPTGVGTVNMDGGSISSPIFFVGNHGTGTFNHNAGTINAGLTTAGTATPWGLGLELNPGNVFQTGGTLNVGGQMLMSNKAASNSLYDISGGTLNGFNNTATPNSSSEVSLRVGQIGTSIMKVRGTAVANVGRHVIVGGNNATTGVGTLEVGGTGKLNVGMGAAVTDGVVGIGANGVGTSIQSGGEINTDFFWTGYAANAVSKGESTQTGGAVNVANDLDVGRASAQNNFYNISGGTINAADELTVARFSNRTSAAPTDPWAGTVSNGKLTISGTAAVAVTGQLSNSTGFTPTTGVNTGIAQPGGVGLIEMNGGTLTAGSFLNGAAANIDPSHAGSGASANYVQTNGTASVGHVTGTGNVSISGGTMNVNSLKQSAVTVTG